MNLYSTHKNHFWQWAWWREDSRRIKAAVSCAVVLLLLAVYVSWEGDSANPQEETETSMLSMEETVPEVTVISRDEIDSNMQSVAENGTVAAAGDEPDPPEAQDEMEQTATVMAQPQLWFLPGDGEFSRGFGYDYDPTYGDFRFHPGCDMKLPIGSLVYAAADGTVLSVTDDDIWGGVVTVDHGQGWTTVYKCITPRVEAGDPVSGGESIGSVIDSPLAEAAQVSHLHFEVYLNEEEIDPLPLFNN